VNGKWSPPTAGLRNGHFKERSSREPVTAVNVETGESRETTTNEEGLYRFNLLPRADMRYACQAGSPWNAEGIESVCRDTLRQSCLHLAGRQSSQCQQRASQVDLASSQIQDTSALQIATLPINDRTPAACNLIPCGLRALLRPNEAPLRASSPAGRPRVSSGISVTEEFQ